MQLDSQFFALWRGFVPEKGSYLTKEGLSRLEVALDELRPTVARRLQAVSRRLTSLEAPSTMQNTTNQKRTGFC
jgi:hypothetical protein